MSRYSGLLERHRLQTFMLPPDKCMHILNPDQGSDGSTQVLYKRRGDSSGNLGGGSFGAVHLETIDSECKNAPAIRAVKVISKRAALTSKVRWEHEVENLLVLSQNVFVVRQRPTWKVKIGDFGFSKRVSDSVTSPFSARGTMNYMAPEYRDLMNNCETSDFTAAVDMWSFGCLIHELFARKCPFDDDTHALRDYVYDGVFPRQPLDDCGASSESIWLIESLLERNPHLRMTAEDAIQCAWLTAAAAPATYKVPTWDEIAQGSRPLSQNDSTATLRPADTLDSLPATSGATLHHTVSAPPQLIVAPDKTLISENSPTTLDILSRPALPDRAITLPEKSLVVISADDTTLPVSRSVQLPKLPTRPKSSNAVRPDLSQGMRNMNLTEAPDQALHVPSLAVQSTSSISTIRSAPIARKPVAKTTPNLALMNQVFPCMKISQTSGDYTDIAFKNIKFKSQRRPTCDNCESRRVFNPVIKQADVYFCKDCGHRPLCARCIVGSIKTREDPHEADHKLRFWIQEYIFPLQEFFNRFQPLDVESDGVDPSFGKHWLSSDHSFTPPSEGFHGVRWVLNAPAGEFSMSIQLRVSHRKEAIESSAIGIQKSMMVNTKAVPLGSILFGARVAEPSQCDDSKASRHLPDRPVEQDIKLAKEEQTLTLKLAFNLTATPKQKIEVHIRGSYDVLYFKAGSPFKWWLEQITITQLGAEQHVASMGDKIMRENAKQFQAKQKRKQRIHQGFGLVGQGLGLAGAKGPVKQGQVMLSAVSAGMGLGMMRHSNSQRPMAQGSNQPAPATAASISHNSKKTKDIPMTKSTTKKGNITRTLTRK
ncbi:MAG: hypothetical protein Q9226_005967 [Calogaya cf. arnoldii]